MNQTTTHWRIGGAQGSGIDKAAQLFARACVQQGLSVLGQREYHSNIAGRHSYFDLAFGPQPPTSVAEYPDLLIAMDGESLLRHLPLLRPGSTVIGHQASAALSLNKLPYLDATLRQHLQAEYGDTLSVQGLLEIAKGHGVTCLLVDIEGELGKLAGQLGQATRELKRVQNTLLVALGGALLGLEQEALHHAVLRLFSRTEHQQMNAAAIRLGYALAEDWPRGELPRLECKPRLLLDATQSVALGKLAAGIGMQSYYPISPATDESSFMEHYQGLPTHDGAKLHPQVIQVEDEIAALGMTAGAALTGVRAATATSGPGFSLMAEGLGWAGMNEVPLVITLYQRGGPSTGMPTRTEQGDLLFTIHAGHGEFPRLVMASGSTEEAFYDAMEAFNYAERFDLPVIHLLDKMLTTSLASVPPFDTRRIPIERGKISSSPPSPDERAKPFRLGSDSLSPRLPLGQPGTTHWRTGVEHDELGLVTENPQLRERMMEKRAARLAMILTELPETAMLREYGDTDAALLVISWGSNLGAVQDALARLQQAGQRARALQIRILWPFPSEAVQRALNRAQTTVVVEGNQSGQLASLLQAQTGHHPDHLIVKYSGRPICGDALAEALETILLGNGEARMVLRNPYE